MSPDRESNNQSNSQEYRQTTQAFLSYNGINPKTHDFLLDCIKYKTFETINTRKRSLIGLYYGTTLHLPELRQLASLGSQSESGVSSYQGIRSLILSGMKTMWASLPGEIKQKYLPKETFLLKKRASPSVAAKANKTRQTSEFKIRFSKIQRDGWARRKHDETK